LNLRLITCDKNIEKATLNFRDAANNWTYLGTYDFPSNKAHIELTDKSKGKLVYADAVMFIRK